MDYFLFTREFDKAHAKLKLPPDCTEVQPPTTIPWGLCFWKFEWVLVFNTDNKYLRVWEEYSKVTGLLLSRRLRFVLHYGPIVGRDQDGNIIRDDKDPVEIRVDNTRGQAHMHYQAPEPHHPQENVEGIDLEALDKFAFIKAILEHRRTGKPLDRILRFKVR